MVEAYLLINCEAGQAGAVLGKMKEMKGVKNVRLVTGLHDIIALIEAPDLTDLAKTVVDKIQRTEGVSRTVTMVAVEI